MQGQNTVTDAGIAPWFAGCPPFPAEGLLCGLRLTPGARPEPLQAEEITMLAPGANALVWLHCNLSDGRMQRWLSSCPVLPETLREKLDEDHPDGQIGMAGDALLLIVRDLAIEGLFRQHHEGMLWACVLPGLVLTARRQPLMSVDALRMDLLRGKHDLSDGIDLLCAWFELRNDALHKSADALIARVNDIEDEILGGRISEKRAQLGDIRRRCAQIRRHYAPEKTQLRKLLAKLPGAVNAAHAEMLAGIAESLENVLNDASNLYERSKLLQEELASRVAEETSRNLYALSLLTAVFLPMTLITGIFGMNVAGVPGVPADPQSGGHAHAFWIVMLLIIATGQLTVWLMLRRQGRSEKP